MKIRNFIVGAALISSLHAAKPDDKAPAAPPIASVSKVRDATEELSVVRVDSTQQAYDFLRPWIKKAPSSRRGIGAILPGGKVLVTAGMVANATYLELESGDDNARIPASVVAVDYEADLALLQANDPKALKGGPPLELADATVGDAIEIVQMEATGAQVSTNGIVTTTVVAPYPYGDLSLLLYRLSSPLQYREGSYTLPILRKGKLTGLLLRYDNRNQTVEAIPAPVIRHFLAAAAKKPGEYHGFPRAGMGFAPLRDASLRRYVKAENVNGGVYVTDVSPRGAAKTAGLKEGDVLVSVAGQAIDADGNYRDSIYGKVAVQHLLSTLRFEGDQVPLEILRDGQRQTLNLTLQHRALTDYVSAPYTDGNPPPYYVLGGLVMTELSRSYLREWGADWFKKAPERFVYLDRFQDELYPEGNRKLVILSQVLPTPLTIGDEQLGGVVVTKVNDQPLNSLQDLPAALAKPSNGFHKIELGDSPHVLYLDAGQTDAIESQVQRSYGLPAMQRLK